MRLPCKSAAETLADGPLSSLLDQARRLDRITAVVESISRELTNAPAPLPATRCTLQASTVIIGVAAPSQAAKLRQCEARILQALRERVPEVTGIRIRLQPGKPNYPMSGIGQTQEIAPPPEGADRLPNPAAVIRFADDLASTLHDSPLRESARRLQATLRKKLAKDR